MFLQIGKHRKPRWTTCIEILDDEHFLASETDCNIFVVSCDAAASTTASRVPMLRALLVSESPATAVVAPSTSVYLAASTGAPTSGICAGLPNAGVSAPTENLVHSAPSTWAMDIQSPLTGRSNSASGDNSIPLPTSGTSSGLTFAGDGSTRSRPPLSASHTAASSSSSDAAAARPTGKPSLSATSVNETRRLQDYIVVCSFERHHTFTLILTPPSFLISVSLLFREIRLPYPLFTYFTRILPKHLSYSRRYSPSPAPG
ncbi:unnamed protein product [Protopolystoma xenopodis]|uniref:RSE1/DDB1/CPSF1 C-terminal domain-containing protein n=1 Tax=Protopolystoma xenopodis TaxID=117903 RepID=A0A448XCH5_9PLAT|nr:unnamed protein product [Protopolystoma xenopodis]